MSGYIPTWETNKVESARSHGKTLPPPGKPKRVRPRPEINGEQPEPIKDVRNIGLCCLGIFGVIAGSGVVELFPPLAKSDLIGVVLVVLGAISVLGAVPLTVVTFMISRQLFFRWTSGRYVRPGYRIATFWEMVSFLFFVSVISGLFWSAFIKESPTQREERIAREWKQYEKPLPASGASYYYNNYPRSSSLSINASSGSHYYIKLVDVATGNPVLVCFIRAGCNATIDVPPGTYEIRYATGKTWYGSDRLFGPETAYSKADKTFEFTPRSGYTLTLFKVYNGNLKTSSINKDSF